MSTQTRRPDILRWRPGKWELFVGNNHLKRVFRSLVPRLRSRVDSGEASEQNRYAFLLTGPSRSGKTAMSNHFVRCLGCDRLDPESLDACDGTCDRCQERPHQWGSEGIFAEGLAIQDPAVYEDRKNRQLVHFIPIDCTRVSEPDLMSTLRRARGYSGLVVLYLDEAHRLVRRNLDEKLLKPIEDDPHLWIFSTAEPDPLEQMFKNRLLKLQTELPEKDELARWLAARCDEWSIPWEPQAVVRVIEKSNRVVGLALHALALASIDPDQGLSQDLVENCWNVTTG